MSDYEIGYGKPPVHTRFKKGQPSANPKGRPKGRKPKNIVERLEKKVVVGTRNGRKVRKTVREALEQKLVKDAFGGDTQALRQLLRHIEVTERTQALAAREPERYRETSPEAMTAEEARKEIAKWLEEDHEGAVARDAEIQEAIRLGILVGSVARPRLANWAREAAETRRAKLSAPALPHPAEPVEGLDQEQYPLL